jgi:nucleotide sugar dehydrogenase
MMRGAFPPGSGTGDRVVTVCIWGAGLCGFTLGCAAAAAGTNVLFVEPDVDRAQRISRRLVPFEPFPDTPMPAGLWDRMRITNPQDDIRAELHVLCVPTERDRRAHKGDLMGAMHELLSRCASTPELEIVLESTVESAWIDEIYAMAQASPFGRKLGDTFHLGCSPRRDVYFQPDKSVTKVAKVLGGDSERILATMHRFYAPISPRLVVASDAKHAAASKVVENVLRLQSIVVANHLAAAFPGMNVAELFDLAGTKWNVDTYYASLGVGGYCIPVAPSYLPAGGNTAVPSRAELAGTGHEQLGIQLLEELIESWPAGRALLLGVADTPNRHSHVSESSRRAHALLRSRGWAVAALDPFVQEDSLREFEAIESSFPFGLRDYDLVVVLTAHEFVKRLSDEELAASLRSPSAVIDTCSCWIARVFPSLIDYRRLGDRRRPIRPADNVRGGNVYAEVRQSLGRAGLSRDELTKASRRLLDVKRDYLELRDRSGRTLTLEEAEERVGRLLDVGVHEWSEEDLDLAGSIILLGLAWIRLEQVDMKASLPNTAGALRSLYADYLRACGLPGDPLAADMVHIAFELRSLRAGCAASHFRIAHIDGSTWFRRELVVRKTGTIAFCKPRRVRDTADAVALLTDALKACCNDPGIAADYAVLLAPRGSNLHQPWAMTREDFLAFVEPGDRYHPFAGNQPRDLTLIRKATLAHHSAKKARMAKKYEARYSADSEVGLADDLGDLGIYFNETAHHKGHQVSGVSSSMRALLPIEIGRSGRQLRVEGLTDIRVNRMSTAIEDRFLPQQFERFYAHAIHIRDLLAECLAQDDLLPAMLGSWRHE